MSKRLEVVQDVFHTRDVSGVSSTPVHCHYTDRIW